MSMNILPIAAAVALVLAPSAAEAQPAENVPRIGFLHVSTEVSPRLSWLRQGLRELGYVEGRNITIAYRYGMGRRDRLARLATELVSLKLDVIVAASTPSARALKRATTTIPIVMVAGSDPVARGLVASLRKPGGNITGLTRRSGRLNEKRLELLKEAFPKVRRVGVLFGGERSAPHPLFRQAEGVAQSLGLVLQPLHLRRVGDLEGVFEQVAIKGIDALITLPSPLLTDNRKRIVEFAARRRLPAMFDKQVWVDAGGLMSYGASIPDIMRRAAVYVDKILKGAKPAEMPVERPTKFDFVINLKTAKALGISLPRSILLRATEVIE